MKKITLLIIAIAMIMVAGCKGKKAESAQPAPEPETFMNAIEKYLVESIAPEYLQGAYSIPFCNWVCADESNPDSIAVLGDFWILNYVQDADTLKTVSGGNHSGKIIICKDAEGNFYVADFDQTLDGSDNETSARRIFGDKFEEYAAAHSDDVARERIRTQSVADFVKRDSLAVKYYKDFGWPAVEIPAE